MDRHCLSTDGEPEPENGKGFQFEKQKQKFAGIAKNKKKNWAISNDSNPSLWSLTAIFQSLILMKKEQGEKCNNVMVIVEPNVPRLLTGE
jgi:hypothetical protein